MDPETIAIIDSRWARTCKLLPNLKYPNDEESTKLVQLAGIRDERAREFTDHIRSIIRDAHLNFSRREFSGPEVKKKLNQIANKATELSHDLRSIDVGSGGSAERAGLLLEFEFGKIKLLPELIDLFQTLGEMLKERRQNLNVKEKNTR
jgi:hypothetical protein